jgi:ribosomal protein S18 acetylase RimI-like enzyme
VAEPEVHFYAMWVDPSHRRRGVGGTLVDAVLRWARDDGAAEARRDVNEENEAAVTLCREAGFTETEWRQPLRERASASTVSMQRAI